jgi:uncharacterized membrane protein
MSLLGGIATDWVNFFTRWVHLIAGISWIGSSFYFMWLDASLEKPEKATPDVEGELWMVHSGGFYQVIRRKIGPGSMPKHLHWFKYEALFTWISGIFLLSLIYHLTGGAYLVDPRVAKLTPGEATGLSLALIVGSWVAYDLLWNSPIGKKLPSVATAICIAGVGALSYGLCKSFSGRGAFIHLGAIFGTIMVANVWIRILPSQQKMIDATKEGRQPDFALSGYAKRRSVHNSYMTFPVLFLMLSNHYAMAFGNALNWVILILLVVLGMSIRHVQIAKEDKGAWAVIPAFGALIALVLMTVDFHTETLTPGADGPRVSFEQVHSVIQSRCVACHSAHPSDSTFGPMPGGVSFESVERIHALAPRIKERAVVTKTMPMANKTGITEDERLLLGRWVDQGAHVQD